MADDDRRAEIEAAINDAMPEMENRFMWAASTGNHPDATAEGAVRTILEPLLDRVRDARGDDEAALNSMWSIMQTQFERGRTPECHGPTRDDAHKMLAGLHRVAARSPQGEDHEEA